MRIDATDHKHPNLKYSLFPCDCVSNDHWLMFEWWTNDPVDEDAPGTLDIIPGVYAPTLRQRITAAVRVLFGRRVWTSQSVLLDEATARQLRATVDAYLAAETAKRGDTYRGDRILWNRRPDDDGARGEIDEVVFHDPALVHIEQLNDACWWIGVYRPDGTGWMGNFTTEDTGVLTFTEQENDGIVWDRDDSLQEQGDGAGG